MKSTFFSSFFAGAGITAATPAERRFGKIRHPVNNENVMARVAAGFFIVTLGATMSACASTAWKEEVLLHDGNKIIISRTYTYDPKGLREPFQPDPLKESVLTFAVPGTKKEITWKSDFGGAYQDNLVLYMVDILNGTPYLVTEPGGCLAYNKWKRPNPPYVLLKYDGEWKRIPLEQFPAEFKELNVVLSPDSNERKKREIQNMTAQDGFVSVENIKKLNRDSRNRTIIRTEVKTAKTACEEMVYYKGAWVGPGDSIGKRMMDGKTK